LNNLTAVTVLVTVMIFSSCISSHHASLKYYKVNSLNNSSKTLNEKLVLSDSDETQSGYYKTEITDVKQKINLDSECDQLILRNGDKKLVEIIFLGKEKIRYKDCPVSKGAEEVVATNEIDSLIFASGTVMVFDVDGTIKGTNREEKNVFTENSLKTEDFPEIIQKDVRVKSIDNYKDDRSLDNSMAKLISKLSGLSFIPVIGFIFSILVFVKAKIGIKQIDDNPEKYSGKRKIINSRRLAILSLSIGAAIVLFFGIIFLVALL